MILIPVEQLIQAIATELERRRPLTTKVATYITETYGIDRDAIGEFLEKQLPALEDDDIDLVLSPVFTPKLPDQAIFADLLGDKTIPKESWPEMVHQLESRPTCALLTTNDGTDHRVVLREIGRAHV